MVDYLNSFNKLEFDKIKSQIARYISSPIGKEYLDKLFPISDIEEIHKALSYLTETKKFIETVGDIPIGMVPDVRKSLIRSSIENFILCAEDLRDIVIFLEASQRIYSLINRNKSAFPLNYSIVKSIYIDKILHYNITQAIDENGRIKDTATKELLSIRRKMIAINEVLRSRLEKILKTVSGKDWVQDEIITTRDGRMVIPIKVEHKNKVPGFIHSSSASGATVFIEPTETLELNNDIRTLQFQEQREIDKILKALTAQVREVREQLLNNAQIIGLIDFLVAKAKYSIEILGAEPKIHTNGPIFLKDARHPILLQRHKRDEVVPLIFKIDSNIKTIVITGPNAGGKTVVLKTIGILTLMVQSGCHIPASPDSEIRIFNKIFVDIGDEQSIENDLSSFSSHLKNLKEIIELSDDNSLVLIDEIASGTDPYESSAISASILEYLTKIGSFTITTTHNSALKAFAHETEGIINAAMEFNQKTLCPTYRIIMGIPGSSYGIEMAERMKLNDQVINRAKEIRGKDPYKIENLLSELQRITQQKDEEFRKLELNSAQVQNLMNLYQAEILKLEREKKIIKQQTIAEAEAFLREMKSSIEKTVQNIKENLAEKTYIKTAKETIKFFQERVKKIKNELEELNTNPLNIKIHDFVQLKQSNCICEVVDIIDDNHLVILAGNVKLRITRDEIQSVVSQPISKTKVHYIAPNSELKRSIDLRGMFGDEAIAVVEKFVDDAILAGLNRVELIHGKGTGRLRKKILEYLKKNKFVKSFRLGDWQEGGDGVTIVEL